MHMFNMRFEALECLQMITFEPKYVEKVILKYLQLLNSLYEEYRLLLVQNDKNALFAPCECQKGIWLKQITLMQKTVQV